MLEERLATIPAAGGMRTQTRGFTYLDFSVCAPPEFKGDTDPISSMRWVADVEGVFVTSGCPDNKRVRYAMNLLRGAAKDWWGVVTATMTAAQLEALTWDEFVEQFRRQYVPRVERERIAREFMTLEQTTETVTEITRKFTEMLLFCPQYVRDEEFKMTRYADMLRTNIREFVNASQHTSLASMIEAARRREIELETQARKRKATPVVAPTTT